MADEITQKHLDRARVRGAPTAIPGSAGMVGSYDFEEIRRNTMRALALELSPELDAETLKTAQQKLAQIAASQGLKVVEPPLLALLSDPMQETPSEWSWQMLLPVSGRAQPDEGAGVSVSRVQGGMYVASHTRRGFADLGNLFAYFLGQFLPARKQELVRPLIYHRISDGLEHGRLDKLTLEVFIPIFLSLKTQPRLVTREEMT
jgi:DNA gyrase inhibitor GyrI